MKEGSRTPRFESVLLSGAGSQFFEYFFAFHLDPWTLDPLDPSPLLCLPAAFNASRFRLSKCIDSLFFQQFQIGDLPGTVHGFYNNVCVVLVLANVDVPPVAHRAHSSPRGTEHQAQRTVIKMFDIHIQDFNLFHTGPGIAGLGHRQGFSILQIDVRKQVSAHTLGKPIVDIFFLPNTAPILLDPSSDPPEVPLWDRRSSKVLIDATKKWEYPEIALPPQDYLDRAAAQWDKYGLD